MSEQLRDNLATFPPITGDEPCRGALNVFYPPRGARPGTSQRLAATARNICRSCPYQPACLEGAITRDEQHGVWGGVNFAFTDRKGETGAARRWRIACETNEIRRWRENDTA